MVFRIVQILFDPKSAQFEDSICFYIKSSFTNKCLLKWPQKNSQKYIPKTTYHEKLSIKLQIINCEFNEKKSNKVKSTSVWLQNTVKQLLIPQSKHLQCTVKMHLPKQDQNWDLQVVSRHYHDNCCGISKYFRLNSMSRVQTL